MIFDTILILLLLLLFTCGTIFMDKYPINNWSIWWMIFWEKEAYKYFSWLLLLILESPSNLYAILFSISKLHEFKSDLDKQNSAITIIILLSFLWTEFSYLFSLYIEPLIRNIWTQNDNSVQILLADMILYIFLVNSF